MYYKLDNNFNTITFSFNITIFYLRENNRDVTSI